MGWSCRSVNRADTDGALAFARRVQTVLNADVGLASGVVRPSASIGVATARVGATIEDMLRESDQAMYLAKGAGKGSAAVFGG